MERKVLISPILPWCSQLGKFIYKYEGNQYHQYQGILMNNKKIWNMWIQLTIKGGKYIYLCRIYVYTHLYSCIYREREKKKREKRGKWSRYREKSGEDNSTKDGSSDSILSSSEHPGDWYSSDDQALSTLSSKRCFYIYSYFSLFFIKWT